MSTISIPVTVNYLSRYATRALHRYERPCPVTLAAPHAAPLGTTSRRNRMSGISSYGTRTATTPCDGHRMTVVSGWRARMSLSLNALTLAHTHTHTHTLIPTHSHSHSHTYAHSHPHSHLHTRWSPDHSEQSDIAKTRMPQPQRRCACT